MTTAFHVTGSSRLAVHRRETHGEGAKGAQRVGQGPRYTIYELSIHAQPGADATPVMRRLRVPDVLTFDDLHTCLLHAFGRPLRPTKGYLFRVGDRRFTLLHEHPQSVGADGVGDSEFTRLADLDLRPGSRLGYVYDFVEFLRHEITVDAIAEASRLELGPTCLEARGAAGSDPDGATEAINSRLAETFSALRAGGR